MTTPNPPHPLTLESALETLDRFAYGRRAMCEDDIRRYFALADDRFEARAEIAPLLAWMLVPITLWPVNIHDLFCTGVAMLEKAEPLDPDLLFLIQTLPEMPTDAVIAVVAEHEHSVEHGRYGSLLKADEKFQQIDSDLSQNSDLHAEWNAIKARWNVAEFADSKGIIRRTLTAERNLRADFHTAWIQETSRFQAVFDIFCMKWNLYGMQGDAALALKLSVNLTPHGTLIFIPAYWSLDAKRDFHWPAVKRLHRVRALSRQGQQLALDKEARREDARKLRKLDADAKIQGLRGQKKHDFLCHGLGWVPTTDPKRLKRLREEFLHEIHS